MTIQEPSPPESPIQLRVDGDVLESSESEVDSDDPTTQGYVLLSTGEDNSNLNNDEEENPDMESNSAEETITLPENFNVDEALRTVLDHDFPVAPKSSNNSIFTDQQSVLDQEDVDISSSKCREIEINDSRADEIKQCMADINLPTNFVPDWAKIVDESQWKDLLRKKLHNLS